jgi:hypothetical protein
MLRPVAVSVRPQDGRYLNLVFDNGERRRFDVSPFIAGEWFGALREPSYFRLVATNGYSVEWPDGQDISPEDLYNLSVPT